MLKDIVNHPWTERIIALALIPVLILSLFLPPASLGVRLFGAGMPQLTPEGGVLEGPHGARLTVPAGAVSKRSRMVLDSLTGADLAAASTATGRGFLASSGPDVKIRVDDLEYAALQTLPAGLVAYEPFYRLSARGEMPSEGRLLLPVPYELAEVGTADLFGWDGSGWQWLPSQTSADALTLEAELDSVPTLMVVAQQQPGAMRLGLEVVSEEPAVAGLQTVNNLSNLAVGGLELQGDGSLRGDTAVLSAPQGVQMLLHLTNVQNGVVRSDLVDNLLISDDLIEAHVEHVLSAAEAFSGVLLDYQGVDADLRAEFTSLVERLATALNAGHKTLVLCVDRPIITSSGAIDTGAYDWRRIGQIADVVRIPAPLDPAAYASPASGPTAIDALLTFATGEIERHKIDLALSAYSQDMAADASSPTTVTYSGALSRLVDEIAADDEDGLILPGESLHLVLQALARAEAQGIDIHYDSAAQLYWFTYQEGGAERTVWLSTGTRIGRQLQIANRYGLGGAAIQGALDEGNDTEVLSVAQSYSEMRATAGSEAVIVATGEPDAGQDAGEKFAFVWTIEDGAGRVVERQVLPLTDPNWTWTAPNNPGDYVIRAAVSTDGGQTDLARGGEVNVQVPTPTFTPTPTATATATPTDTPTPTATPTNTPTARPTVAAPAAPAEPAEPAAPAAPAPAPVVPAGRVGGYFGYGIQPHMYNDPHRVVELVRGMGFNWVKQQVEWFKYNPAPGQYSWGDLDHIVDIAHANGLNVMLSVVKAPRWARPAGDTHEGPPSDPNTYATFVRELAARYRGRVQAYEIWNEQNLYYEWGGRGHKLSAARYMDLLRPAYAAIKAVDPGAVVISGALTPTGVNDGDVAIDDRIYLEQMYQLGLRNYCDAVGSHPSGYNNPPDADWRTWSDPDRPTFKGHPSFFFRGTMESYRNIMVKYGDGGKRIWPTEFGWATVEGLGVGPAAGYEYAGQISEAQQAQYLVRAYQMGRAWGWVGPMITWNLNFAPTSGAHDEKAAFGILRADWAPRPAYAALRDMGK